MFDKALHERLLLQVFGFVAILSEVCCDDLCYQCDDITNDYVRDKQMAEQKQFYHLSSTYSYDLIIMLAL